ncbi:TetR/AcrR family transcriptional regulator [uncultured Draconibacterium sp.]|uniref:TetR/AcrR family transcriptional regulator n=1 Tax=uncultured Draconibacterium sp. TaxID=1573823 RepID=UPI0025F70BC2|nr:TetR/AcrR family transcriptional regulator [uncultured Draconibacterium sp.]
MPRNKAYNEQEVLEKAMNVFWENGYETTSMHQLEKAMGINKFSIYASFGSKSGLLEKSISCYAQKLNAPVYK